MHAIKRIIGVGLLLLSHATLSAPADLLAELHKMRLAASGMSTHFYMFSGLEADAKYNRLVDVSKQEFETALAAATKESSASGAEPSLADIDKQWQVVRKLLETNRNDVLTKGFAEIRLVDDMGRASTKLVEDVSNAYLSVQNATSVSPPPVVEKARTLAMLMAEMTSLYAAEGTSNLGYLFVGTGENEDGIVALADEFQHNLQQLEAMNVAQDARQSLRNVGSKWRFIEERVRKHNENSVPFLVVSYNEKIQEHLAAIESSYR